MSKRIFVWLVCFVFGGFWVDLLCSHLSSFVKSCLLHCFAWCFCKPFPSASGRWSSEWIGQDGALLAEKRPDWPMGQNPVPPVTHSLLKRCLKA